MTSFRENQSYAKTNKVVTKCLLWTARKSPVTSCKQAVASLEDFSVKNLLKDDLNMDFIV